MISRKYKIMICAYCVDKHDVGEAKMAYDFVEKLSAYAEIFLLTAGSRYRLDCGLEGNENVKVFKIKPAVSFKWWDTFDRAVHPGYVEFYFRARKLIKEILVSERIDVCHHLAPFSLRYPTPFSNLGADYVVGPIYGGLKAPEVMKQLNVKEGLMFKLRSLDDLRLRYDPFLRNHFSDAGRIMISAPYVRDLLPDSCHKKCKVVSGIAIDKVEPKRRSRSQGDLRMAFVGRIVPSKGLELLIEALGLIRDKGFELSVFGKGSKEADYKNLALRLGVGEKISWKGFTLNGQVREALGDMDVLVMPSLKEPAGIAVIEAMAAGVGVVCVDHGGPGYSVDDLSGRKIKPAGREEMIRGLAEAVGDLADNPEKTVSMGMNAYERAMREFSWDSVIEKVLGVYEEFV